jgi:GNAT superfamily N-acetyltransferase
MPREDDVTFRAAGTHDADELRSLDAEAAEADVIDGERFYVLRQAGVLDYFFDVGGVLVAEQKGRLIAYALAHPVAWMHGIEKLIWIEHITVHPERRRQGVGLHLLEFIEQHHSASADQLYAEIHPLNTASIALFTRFGAELVDRKLAFKAL